MEHQSDIRQTAREDHENVSADHRFVKLDLVLSAAPLVYELYLVVDQADGCKHDGDRCEVYYDTKIDRSVKKLLLHLFPMASFF